MYEKTQFQQDVGACAAAQPNGRPNGSVAPLPTVYSVREAAVLLGCSADALERHFADLHGYRIGRRILFPRWAIDRLVCDPAASEQSAGDNAGTPVERVLTMLSLLSGTERVRVAQAALGAVDG